jgi:hypothetical protein
MEIIKSINDNRFVPNQHKRVHMYGELNLKDKEDVKGSWNFFNSDSYKLLLKNLEKKPKDWYYRNKEITYTLNSDGYRTKEFDEIDWKNSIVMFGCSHVFGTGNDDADTIPNILENELGIPVINMGINGSSNMVMLHNSLMLNNRYERPKMIIYLWTSLVRQSFYSHDYMDSAAVGYLHQYDYEGSIENSKPLIYNSILGMETNLQMEVTNTLVNNYLWVNIIRNMWKNECLTYEASLFKNTASYLKCDFYHGYSNDLARDDIHYGVRSNHKIAKGLYKKIKKVF